MSAARPGPVARLLAALVTAYRNGVSPLVGPRCRFEPTCSRYAHEALLVHGAGRGTVLSIWRLLRCQPFGTPGYDPVPARRTTETPTTRSDGRTAAPLRGAGPC